MKTYAFRLHRGQDLKKELIEFTRKHDIQAGAILTCVGALSRAVVRMADPTMTIRTYEKDFEIVSLVGTLSQDGVHLHIALADENGECTGGHLKDGCIVSVTAEIIIADLENVRFSREMDKQTGYAELVVK